jgi:hypothetical protein
MKNAWLCSLALGASFLTLATAAAAQNKAGDRVETRYLIGDEQCPQSTDEVIIVCGRIDEPYRIPPGLRGDPNSPKNEAWAQRVRSFETVGAFGTNSCDPAGAGGFTGCTQALIAQARGEKAQDPGIQAGLLIQQERERRLALIDEEAAAVEERLQEIDRELAEREATQSGEQDALNAEAEALGADLNTDDLTQPPVPTPAPATEPN